MSPELLALIEKMIMSPTLQDEAWMVIKAELLAGRIPTQDAIDKANALVDKTHAEVAAIDPNYKG